MTNGMKSGAGSDPFANDTSDDNASSGEQDLSEKESDEPSDPEPKAQADTDWSGDKLPYIHERNTVKSDRKMIQYFLRDEVQAIETDAHRAMEEELGPDVSLTDVREALVIVGAEHLDEVADELRAWGYRFREK